LQIFYKFTAKTKIIMYRRIEDFQKEWKSQQGYTVKTFSTITEETKGIKISDHVRSLERLAWHITQTLTEMGSHAGLFEQNVLGDLPIPATFAEIIGTYQQYAELFGKAVTSKWTDSSLEDNLDMYGQQWTRGQLLSIVIGHESHHRSQMSVIMRMVGLPVPGIYGPSKEEWESMGMPALD
jgi:uncharacterized damage-inducible protein DinB